jgi:hypothetical protein
MHGYVRKLAQRRALTMPIMEIGFFMVIIVTTKIFG